MGAEVFIRGKVAPCCIGSFRGSVLYRAFSHRYPEIVIWGALNAPEDGYCYCTITAEVGGAVRELARVRYTDRLEEEIMGPFGRRTWVPVAEDTATPAV